MEEKATEKQIEFAKKLGIKNPETYSKGTIRELIDKAIAEREGKKPEDKVEIVKMNEPKASNGGFHLSPEEVRCRALEMAFSFNKELGQLEDYFAMAEGIEKWILR